MKKLIAAIIAGVALVAIPMPTWAATKSPSATAKLGGKVITMYAKHDGTTQLGFGHRSKGGRVTDMTAAYYGCGKQKTTMLVTFRAHYPEPTAAGYITFPKDLKLKVCSVKARVFNGSKASKTKTIKF